MKSRQTPKTIFCFRVAIAMFFLFATVISCTKTDSNGNSNTKVIISKTTSINGDTTSYKIDNLLVTVSKTSPCYPSTEIFTFKADASKITDASTINWYFGDGYSDTGNEVHHGYNNAAPYVVLLEIKNNNGTVIYTTTLAVDAWGQQLKPEAIFSYKNDFSNNPNYITFNSASSVNHGSIINYHWDWGDGTTSSISTALTRHAFPTATNDVNYKVKLTITTDAGCTADTTLSVLVPAIYPITGDFDAVSYNTCSNEYFVFTPTATKVPTGSVYSWHWSNGTGDTTGSPMQYSFYYMNDYDVIMTILLNGRTIYTVHKLVHAKGPKPTPKASFEYQWVKEYPTDVLVSFKNTSISPAGGGGIDGYYWDFGNGKTDNDFNAFTKTRYERGAAGTGTISYPVRLIVTGNGCADTAYNTVVIPAQ